MEMLDDAVFCFGSNKLGIHGAGAALYAKNNHGAVQGQGEGRQGNSYAIPTKDTPLGYTASRSHQNARREVFGVCQGKPFNHVSFDAYRLWFGWI